MGGCFFILFFFFFLDKAVYMKLQNLLMIKLKNKSHSTKLTKKKELESNLKEEKNEEG